MTKSDLVRAMPSRNTVTSHIKSIGEKSIVIVNEFIKASITEAGCFGVTCDLWTEKQNSNSFLTVTVHLFVQTASALQLKPMVIDICEMKCSSMTGENIKQAILDVFASYHITEDDLLKYACFVTDRGSNMLAAVRDFESQPCLAHLCNNVVHAMLEVPAVKTIVANASKLVKYVKKSHIASR